MFKTGQDVVLSGVAQVTFNHPNIRNIKIYSNVSSEI